MAQSMALRPPIAILRHESSYHWPMPAYSYEALSAQGETRKGIVDSDSVKGARALLRTQGLVPLAVVGVTPGTDKEGRPHATG